MKQKREIKIGVYKIINIFNNKLYIGSSINIYGRWQEHRRNLKNNTHHSSHLQNAWNKYGEENFKFQIIEECDENEVLIREQYYLDLYKTYKRANGYNISKSANAPMTGRNHSEETLKILSEGVRSRDSSCWIRGEDKPNSKFKDEDIVNIKILIFKGNKICDIAKLYNVEANTITQIKTGERWSHIKTEYDDLIVQTPKIKLTNVDYIIDIKRRLADGENTKDIANLYNISRGSVYAIKQLRVWIDIGSEYNDIIKNRNNQVLSKEQEQEILILLSKGEMKQTEIAKLYNVSKYNISDVKQRNKIKQVV